MSATRETIAAIQVFIGQLEQARTAAGAASAQADKARAMATALGAAGNIIALAGVHELLAQADILVAQALHKAQEAIGQAHGVHGG